MVKRLYNYWAQKLGFGEPKSKLAPSYHAFAAVPSGHRESGGNNIRELNKLSEQLQVAMALFTAGQRVEAMPILERILAYPLHVDFIRMTAACLLAESYRGIGEFNSAEQFYEISVQEAENISYEERSHNEWYQHYRPRALLGLLNTYRRTLYEDHTKIQSMLRGAIKEVGSFAQPDLLGQLYLIEGMYLRQIGDVSNSVNRIEAGYKELEPLSPPYLFLTPEFAEALQLLSFLCQPGSNIFASRLARKTLSMDVSPWSTAIAAAGLLHLHLRRIVPKQFDDFSQAEFGEDELKKVEKLIKKLVQKAGFERDPLIISEAIMLEIIWNLLNEQFADLPQQLTRLVETVAEQVEPLRLLRAVEIGALRKELTLAGWDNCPAVQKLLADGKELLIRLRPSIESYGYQPSTLQQWNNYLSGEQPTDYPILANWSAEPLRQLRAIAWP